jgi:hypothetical protein
MKKLLPLLLIIICCQFYNFKTLADNFQQNAWVDRKEICEESNGNWRLYNNICGDSCESKFALTVCALTLVYNCDCGNNGCFDGNKCVSNKIAQKLWEDKAKEDDLKRKKELEDLNILPKIAEEEPSMLTNKNSTPQVALLTEEKKTLIADQTKPLESNTKKITNTAALIDPFMARINDAKKLLCTQQSGEWKEFGNGCVDNCSNKISKMSICTQALTFGCKCGETKCWDATKNSCIETKEYKKLITG